MWADLNKSYQTNLFPKYEKEKCNKDSHIYVTDNVYMKFWWSF